MMKRILCIKIRHVHVPMGLGFKLKRKNIRQYQNLKTPAFDFLENGNYHGYRKLFHAKQHFIKWIPMTEIFRNEIFRNNLTE